jgi:DNA-3-methyladenine glycosylase II
MTLHGNVISLPSPYDFGLSLRAARSFRVTQSGPPGSLRFAAKISGVPTLVRASAVPGRAAAVSVSSNPSADPGEVARLVQWVLVAELKLRPFYRKTDHDPKLGSIIRRLHGLKPMRPLSLFEMAITAITEQQISLGAAYHIRSRLVERFGTPVQDEWIFPDPAALAGATLRQLLACGLSYMKAGYIRELARKVTDRTFDFDALKAMKDEQARERLMELKGFGRWSADYILVRGLARPDSLPDDDLGLRWIVGKYLGSGRRLTADSVVRKLEPYRPFRGLTAFYLLADYRLSRVRQDTWSGS